MLFDGALAITTPRDRWTGEENRKAESSLDEEEQRIWKYYRVTIWI